MKCCKSYKRIHVAQFSSVHSSAIAQCNKKGGTEVQYSTDTQYFIWLVGKLRNYVMGSYTACNYT